jgi:hypothetical protein
VQQKKQPDMRTALLNLRGCDTQGVSGQIVFGIGGDPVNKAIVVLHVNDAGEIGMQVPPNSLRVAPGGCL